MGYNYIQVTNNMGADIHFGVYLSYQYTARNGQVTHGGMHLANTGYYPVDQNRSIDPKAAIEGSPPSYTNFQMKLYVHAAGGSFGNAGTIDYDASGYGACYTASGTVDDMSISGPVNCS